MFEGICRMQWNEMLEVLTAWKAVRSEATVTGDEVLGESECKGSAWKAVRLWQGIVL